MKKNFISIPQYQMDCNNIGTNYISNHLSAFKSLNKGEKKKHTHSWYVKRSGKEWSEKAARRWAGLVWWAWPMATSWKKEGAARCILVDFTLVVLFLRARTFGCGTVRRKKMLVSARLG